MRRSPLRAARATRAACQPIWCRSKPSLTCPTMRGCSGSISAPRRSGSRSQDVDARIRDAAGDDQAGQVSRLDAAALLKIADKHAVAGLVIGLPLETWTASEEARACNQTRAFIRNLAPSPRCQDRLLGRAGSRPWP